MIEELIGKMTRLVFECAICQKVYQEPGMCNTCQAVLKVKGG